MPKKEDKDKGKPKDKGMVELEAKVAALETRVAALEAGQVVTPTV